MNGGYLILILSIIAIDRSAADGLGTDLLQDFTDGAKKALSWYKDDHLDPIDHFLLDVVPKFIGQAPNNENGTRLEFKDYVLKDHSNDDAAHLSLQELITRSGYKYEISEAIADDGYVTRITHLINPLADKRYLRQPPVLLEHGGTIDPTAYVIASSIQHYPEPWPRHPVDGPITSWNRSLAFVLANNGFDVWLAETRGSSDENRRHIKNRAMQTMMSGANSAKNMTLGENMAEIMHQRDYWAFSQDDIIEHELKSHIDLVLSRTGAKTLSLMTFSLSTPTSLSFFSIRPDYAQKINALVSMAPIVSGEGTNLLVKWILQKACPMVPNKVGTLMLSDMILSKPIRNMVLLISRIKPVRYSLVKAITTLLMGPSAKYQTLLDLNVMGHLLKKLSFKEVKQLCQQTKHNKLQKFDYGRLRNRLIYGTPEPPVYDLSDLKIKDWIIVAGANDKLSTPEVIDHLMKIVHPKPSAYIVAPGLNHLDLIAGFENDRYVNLPILAYLKNRSLTPEIVGSEDLQASSSRQIDIRKFFPKDFDSAKIADTARNFTKSLANVTTLDPMQFFENFRKSLQTMLGAFFKLDPQKNMDRKEDV